MWNIKNIKMFQIETNKEIEKIISKSDQIFNKYYISEVEAQQLLAEIKEVTTESSSISVNIHLHKILCQMSDHGFDYLIKSEEFFNEIYGPLFYGHDVDAAAAAQLFEEALSKKVINFSQLTDLFQEHEDSISFTENLTTCINNYPYILNALFENGMDLNIRDSDGKSLLASMVGDIGREMRYSADYDKNGVKKQKAQDEINKQNSIKNIYSLIEKGADISQPFSVGIGKNMSFLDYLLGSDLEKTEDVKKLAQYVAEKTSVNHSFNLFNKYFKTSDVAVEKGFFNVAAYLLRDTTKDDLKIINKKLYEPIFVRKAEAFLLDVMGKSQEIDAFFNLIKEEDVSSYNQELANLVWLKSAMFNDKEAIKLLKENNIKFVHSHDQDLILESIFLTTSEIEEIIELLPNFPGLANALSLSSKESFMHKIAKKGDYKKFIEYAKLGFNCDLKNEDQKTPIDEIILRIKNNPDFDKIVEEITQYSSDSFYTDNNVDVSSDKIYLGIPSAKNFWDNGHIALARVLSQKNPLIRPVIFAADDVGQGILSKLNGLLVPGGGDSYPKDADGSFTLDDFTPTSEIENLYQKIYDYAYDNSLPFVGMCLGNQYHALVNGEALMQVDGYTGGDHQAYVKPGTLEYFMMLDDSEKNKYLKNADFVPEIKLEIDTAHGYAISDSSLSGVISEENVAQSYASGNHVTFQFHPEHYASDVTNKKGADAENKMRQENIFESLVGMMSHHKQAVKLAKFLHESKSWSPFSLDSIDFRIAVNKLDKYYADLENILSQRNELGFSEVDNLYNPSNDNGVCEIGAIFSYGDSLDQ